MAALPGRGFDSRQLHKKANTAHPRKGVRCLLREAKKLAFEASRQKEGNHAEHVAGFNRQA